MRLFVCVPGEFEEESKQPTLSEEQKHQLKHRELFLSRQFESLPATHIRYVLRIKRLLRFAAFGAILGLSILPKGTLMCGIMLKF